MNSITEKRLRNWRVEISSTIRELRTERNISQQEIADLIGCSRPRIDRIEKGEGGYDPGEIDLMSLRFGMEPKELYQLIQERLIASDQVNFPGLLAVEKHLKTRWKSIVNKVQITGVKADVLRVQVEVLNGPYAQKFYRILDAVNGSLPNEGEIKHEVRNYCQDIITDIFMETGITEVDEVPAKFWETEIGTIIMRAISWSTDAQ